MDMSLNFGVFLEKSLKLSEDFKSLLLNGLKNVYAAYYPLKSCCVLQRMSYGVKFFKHICFQHQILICYMVIPTGTCILILFTSYHTLSSTFQTRLLNWFFCRINSPIFAHYTLLIKDQQDGIVYTGTSNWPSTFDKQFANYRLHVAEKMKFYVVIGY